MNPRVADASNGSSSRLTGALAFLGIVWGFWVAYRFYAFAPFPPLTIFSLGRLFVNLPSTFSAFADRLFSSGSAAVLLFAGYVTGRVILNRWVGDALTALEELVFSTAIGLGLFVLVSLILGAARLLYPALLASLVFGTVIAGGAWLARKGDKRLIDAFNDLRTLASRDKATAFLLAAVALLVTTDALLAFTPELFYDALVYHLGIPNLYLVEHRILAVENLHASFPFLIQMIYLWAMALPGEAAPRIVHVGFLALLAFACLAFGERINRPRAGVIAAAFFAAIPTVQLNVWSAGTDVAASAYGIFAIAAYILSEQTGHRRLLDLAAVLGGLAAGTKYPAALIPAAIAVTIVVARRANGESFSSGIRVAARYSAVALVAYSPWLIKNALTVGNPVYPFFSDVMGTFRLPHFDAWIRGNAGLAVGSPVGFLRAVWALTISERSPLGFLGPAFLGLAGVALIPLVTNRWRGAGRVALVAGLALATAMISTRHVRFLLPFIAAAALWVGFAFDVSLERSGRPLKAGLWLLFGTLLTLQISWLADAVENIYQPHAYLAGRVSRQDYLSGMQARSRIHFPWDMYRWINANVPKESRVLLFGEDKSYGLEVPYVPSGVYDVGPLRRALERKSGPDDVYAALRNRLGITHLFFNVLEADRLAGYDFLKGWSPETLARFLQFADLHLRPVHVEEVRPNGRYYNRLVLFELVEKQPGRESNEWVPLAEIFERHRAREFGINSEEKIRRLYSDLQETWPSATLAERLAPKKR